MTATTELKAIREIVDPQERAARLSAFITDTDQALGEARKARDELIVELRATGLSQPKIGEIVGVSLSTVKAVLR